MRNTNTKLLLGLFALIVLVAAAGLLFGGGLPQPDQGQGPISITATEGLVIPDAQQPVVYDLPADTAWLSIRADGFTYPNVPLLTEGDYTFTQPDGGCNTLHVTPTGMYMHSADCSTQDCVNQGKVDLDVIEFRPLGGQIICLPHQLIVELIPPGGQNLQIVLEDTQP